MTTNQNNLISQELVQNCRHSRLRAAMMSHTPNQPRVYRSTAVMESPTMSNEAKAYAGILMMSLVALLSHAIIGISSF